MIIEAFEIGGHKKHFLYVFIQLIVEKTPKSVIEKNNFALRKNPPETQKIIF